MEDRGRWVDASADDRGGAPVVGSSHEVAPHEARGALRDALATLTNLEHLVRSPRVGHKPLAAILPEARALRAPVQAAISALLVRVAVHEEAHRAFQLLSTWSDAGLARLFEALARAGDDLSAARQRLALEPELRRAVADLAATSALVDLLRVAESRLSTELDLREAVGELAHSIPGEVRREPRLTIIAALDDAPQTVLADVRLVTGLLGIAAATVHRAGVARPVVTARPGAAGQVEIAVGPTDAHGDALVITPPQLVEPTEACAVAAATLADARFEVTDGGRRVVTTWKAG